MKRAFLLVSAVIVLVGLTWASIPRHRTAAPAAASKAALSSPASGAAASGSAAPSKPVAVAAEIPPAAAQRPAVHRPAPRRHGALARSVPASPPKEAERSGVTRSTAGSTDLDGEKQPKAPATAESLAQWTFADGDAITPVLSPELRDMTPIRTSGDEPRAVENERLPYRGERPGQAPVQGDGALQSQPGHGITAPTPTGVNFAGIAANGHAPSDDNGRVGPNHYIQIVNTQFSVYSKAGAVLFGPAQVNTLWSTISGPCKTHNDGDPIVQYDQLADRWIMSQFAVDAPPTGLASYQCMAISKTGDPLGAYYLYPFPLAPALFFDYPHVSTWPDGYYSTVHVFDETLPPAQQFRNQGLVVFERDQMLAGLPARLVNKSIGTPGAQEFFGGLAADLDGLTPPPLGSPEYLFIPGSSEWDGSSAPMIHFFKLATTWGATPGVTVTGPTNILTAAFTTNLCGFSRNCVPQPAPAGVNDKFDSILGQFMWRAAYRNNGGTESIVLNHTVNALVPPANKAGIRWYEIRTPATTPTIFQQGTFAPDADWRVVGSITQDNGGNIALGYTKSNTAVFPEIDVTGRLAGDAAGTMGAEIVMQAGVGSQIGTANRWGDYSAMSVDPRDGCTFWYTTQYIPVSGSFTWGTRVGAFKFPPANCSAPAQGTLSGTVTDLSGNPVPGALVKLDNGFSGATNASGVYTIVLPPGATNAIASAPQRPGCNLSPLVPVTVNNGATTTQNFVLGGNAMFFAGPIVIDDSTGNNNGHINKSECIFLDIPIDDLGCTGATGISAVLSTTTTGVTVTQNNATYPNAVPGARVNNNLRYKLSTSAGLVCGTPISLTLTVTSSVGVQAVPITLPTCDTPITNTGALTAGDPTQTLRLFRGGLISSCGTTSVCPGTSGSGAPHYDSYTYTNTAATSRCVTVDVTPNCSGGPFIYTAAYLGSFDPTNVCTNYLADPGSSPANGVAAEYAFDVAAGATFVVVVHEVTPNAGCSAYTVQVSGLDDTTSGPGCSGAVCPTITLAPATLPSATPGVAYSQDVTPSGGTGPYTFNPTTGLPPGITATPSATKVTLAGTATSAFSGTVTVSGTDANACPFSKAYPFSVVCPAAPPVVITAPATVRPLVAGAAASVPDAGVGATYAWIATGATINTATNVRNITFTPRATGFVTLQVTVTPSGSTCGTVATVIIPILTGDFSLDGKPDLLWRNTSSGLDSIWSMNGFVFSSIAGLPTVPDTNYELVGSGDFDGDGKPDLLWRHKTLGFNSIWLMNGLVPSSVVSIPTVTDTNWRIEAVGDLDGDGKPDIFWRNTSTGGNGVWLMNGTSFSSVVGIPAVIDTNWDIVGVADFDFDGKVDIVWRNHSNGLNGLWVMNGTTVNAVVSFPTVLATEWQIVAVGDYDQDGKPDLVWRNKNVGFDAFWKMNGTAVTSVIPFTDVFDTTWTIAGPR